MTRHFSLPTAVCVNKADLNAAMAERIESRVAQVIIAGGMGRRVWALFTEKGIAVAVGASSETPEGLIEGYLARTLKTGDNICDH